MIYFSCKRKWGLNKVLGLPVSATRDFFFFLKNGRNTVCVVGGGWGGGSTVGLLLIFRCLREKQTIPSVFPYPTETGAWSWGVRSVHQSPALSSALPERSRTDIMVSDSLLASLSVRFCIFFLFFRADARAWPCCRGSVSMILCSIGRRSTGQTSTVLLFLGRWSTLRLAHPI